ncbi:MAG TPA: hypothetical protein VGZ00_12325 [Candidatus Baltobacteraceae bacterium]|jgi:hypothetical protein|nr:hypothetical protein [Candidatus Baltobacteraceae bacterium]
MSTKKREAWGESAASESRWPASLAVIVAALLNFLLPARYTLGPPWFVSVLELAILIPLSFISPRRTVDGPRWHRLLGLGLIGVVNLANLASLFFLIHNLIFNGRSIGGPELLYSSVGIWLTNVIVFALWYWELDRGGPGERLKPEHREPDFLFPQMMTPGCARQPWSPTFIDYVYVAFTNATAFSPTDTMPLTPWAKTLMLIQSSASLLTIAVVAARAVNILT